MIKIHLTRNEDDRDFVDRCIVRHLSRWTHCVLQVDDTCLDFRRRGFSSYHPRELPRMLQLDEWDYLELSGFELVDSIVVPRFRRLWRNCSQFIARAIQLPMPMLTLTPELLVARIVHASKGPQHEHRGFTFGRVRRTEREDAQAQPWETAGAAVRRVDRDVGGAAVLRADAPGSRARRSAGHAHG